MPYVILRYAEYRINKIPEYQVKIADIDIHLYRGSYTIKNIRLFKIKGKIPVPFFAADRIDFAVQWRVLLHGKLVAQISADRPAVNFVTDPAGKNEQLTINDEWRNAVKALFPLNFNKIKVSDGTLHLRSFSGQPPFDLYLKNINGEINNLRNVERSQQRLPSSLLLKANSMDGAPLAMEMYFDPFSKQPTFYLKVTLENMSIKEANGFLHHYTKIDVKQGLFSLYIEAAAKKGEIKGYAKPFIKNLEVTDSNESKTPIEALYKGALQIVAKILENPQKKTVATQINISGSIENPDTSIWSIIGNLLSHAFLQALLPKIDNTVDIRDIELNY